MKQTFTESVIIAWNLENILLPDSVRWIFNIFNSFLERNQLQLYVLQLYVCHETDVIKKY